VRDGVGLNALLGTLEHISQTNETGTQIDSNEVVTARLIATGALAREESRGGHFRSDFPETSDPAQRSFVSLRKESNTHVPSP
jgi:L-aspartate oxidase